MRMRRKKSLDERLAASMDYMIYMHNESPDFNDAVNEQHYIGLAEYFGNDNPVYLEIGCGKGQFAVEWAKRNPDKNILCVERDRNVIILAIDLVKENGLKNVKFICGTAEYLISYLPPESIEEIYLNFSCPFPKARHKAHRLTNPRFLNIYKCIMKNGAVICQKTDNMHFFEYSIESFTQNGFKLKNISLDLHNSGFEGNIVTEYEYKFSSQGFPIYRLEAYID